MDTLQKTNIMSYLNTFVLEGGDDYFGTALESLALESLALESF